MSASHSQSRGTSTGPLRIGLLGHGTVGGAFAALLHERADEIERFNGRRPVIAGVLTRTSGTFAEVLADADLIVELIGGVSPAREYVLAAMRAGRDVVSANKQLISQHGEELFAVAREHDVRLRFEAAVAGAVPVVRLLEESLAATPIERVHGIVNGTTNYILSEMARGSDYAQALADAQRRGYAEADPSDDVSGRDAAAKMAIIARLAFGAPVHLDDVPYEGIEHLRLQDIEYARELGLGLKLIGTAERRDGGLSVRVYPAFLYAGHPLSSVSGPFNAVTVESETITEITMSGPGAGGLQTASAVLGDVVSVMTGGARPPAEPLSFHLLEDVPSAFYLHLDVLDRPGVLAEVTRVLGEHDVSIRSFVQRGVGAVGAAAGGAGAQAGGAGAQAGGAGAQDGSAGAQDGSAGAQDGGAGGSGSGSGSGMGKGGEGDGDGARLVMVTHAVPESRLRAAIAQLQEFEFVRAAPRTIRVIEEEFM